MNNIDKINSILEAVDEINGKSKKRSVNFEIIQNSTPKINQNLIPKLNQNLSISPDIDKLIQEAEEYKDKLLIKTSKIFLEKKNNNPDKTSNRNNSHQDIQDEIIENLYTKLKKKIKKNTLKIIFNLHLKIKDLEKKLENSNIENEQPSDQIKHNSYQYERIKILKNTEEKLRLHIINLEQDKSVLLQKIEKFNDVNEYKKNINNTKKSLKSVYAQVEKQKKIFIELKNYSTKIEQESIIYKENYEKLIIENNRIKNKLLIYKD